MKPVNSHVLLQFDEEDIEEDAPLEKRKKMFSKECKVQQQRCQSHQMVYLEINSKLPNSKLLTISQ